MSEYLYTIPWNEEIRIVTSYEGTKTEPLYKERICKKGTNVSMNVPSTLHIFLTAC